MTAKPGDDAKHRKQKIVGAVLPEHIAKKTKETPNNNGADSKLAVALLD